MMTVFDSPSGMEFTRLRLWLHSIRAAASRTFWTAGTSRPIRIAMIAMTTSSSISVNADLPRVRGPVEYMGDPLKKDNEQVRELINPGGPVGARKGRVGHT